jgi:hypothetical protein
LPRKKRDPIRDLLTMQHWLQGFCAGGVSTIGGFGFGLAGAGMAPGAGLTSIGGGNGAACRLTAAGGRAAGG